LTDPAAGFRCPLCGHRPATVRFKRSGIPVCACGACGFVFAPAGAVIATRGPDDVFYSLDYFDGRADSGYAAYTDTLGALERNAAHLLDAVLAARSARGCLLEVGSGAGQFLERAGPHFTRVYGVEICAGICTRALPSNVTLFERRLETILPSEMTAPADVIVLWDVIEHFPDPVAVMELLGRLAGPGCLIFLTTGNVASPLARLLGKRWRLMTPLEHYSFFAPSTIRKAAAAGGFQIEQITSPWKWVPLVLVAAQLGRMFGAGRFAWRWVPRSWRVPLTLGDVMLVRGRHT
jgi:SAM-dependent methyltransferase